VLVAGLLLTIYRLFGIKRLGRRRKVRDQRRLVANAARPRKVLSPTLASKITERRQADVVRESLSIPRCLNAAREPLNRAHAIHDLERFAPALVSFTTEGGLTDRDLIGRQTAMGLIPKTLRPVFRDRDDFTAGHSLSEQTLAALDDSAAFIVLGSPDAAPADNSHHSGRKAWHPTAECFPLAL
jgi:hypothetical protein